MGVRCEESPGQRQLANSIAIWALTTHLSHIAAERSCFRPLCVFDPPAVMYAQQHLRDCADQASDAAASNGRENLSGPARLDCVALHGKNKRCIGTLAFLLGLAQGCGMCFFMGSGSYFSDVFEDPHFFIKACGLFYLPPILVIVIQMLVSRRLHARFGVRRAMHLRLLLWNGMVTLLLTSLGSVVGAVMDMEAENLVYAHGFALGCSSAAVFGACNMSFGAMDPHLGAMLLLGQTVAGIYTSVVAHVVGFRPGCSAHEVRTYFHVAAATVAAIGVFYWCCAACGVLEQPYRLHEELFRKSCSTPGSGGNVGRSPTAASQVSTIGPSSSSVASRVLSPRGEAAKEVSTWCRCRCNSSWWCSGDGGATWLGFPTTCWNMALCQVVAIAMGMSLMPLANQIAHGRYALSQELVLSKLLADFVGRTAFFGMPKPTLGSDACIGSLRTHALLLWVMAVVRAPMWASIFAWATGSKWPMFSEKDAILLYAVWWPLISMGAFSASWCTVVAMTAAPDEVKQKAPLLLSVSNYAGCSVGVLIAATAS